MNRIFIFILVIFCIGCEHDLQTKGKVPGSYHSLQMLSKGRAYPNIDISPDDYGKAYQYHKKEFLQSIQTREDRVWEAMGPLNTTGRTLTMAFNPQNTNTIYAGSASGGLWRSYTGGAGISWERVKIGLPTLGVSSIAFAPADSMTIYIGTGEVYNINRTGDDGAYRSTRGSYGFGILKSTDGGVSWSQSLDWTYNNQEGVWMIKVAPNDPNIVTAATTDGIYRSLDAGVSWNQILAVDMATDIEVDPDDPDRMIAACGNFGSLGKGIYRTVDGGTSWDLSSDVPSEFQGKIQLAMFNQDADILYASVGNGFGFSDGATWTLKTEDFGENWEIVNTQDYSRWQGWFAHDIAIHPTDPSIIIPIGIDIWKSSDGGIDIIPQSSGGVTLGTPNAGVPDGGPFYSHSDHHFVMYHPTDASIVYYANDGGIFRSDDGGETFASMNGGMQTAQFYHGFAVSPVDENIAIGGLQDNSTSIFRGDGNWTRAVGGDGAWAAVDPLDRDVMYGSSQNLRVTKSVDGGESFFTVLQAGSNDIPVFIAPVAVAPSDGDILYAAGTNIYKSETQADFFTEIEDRISAGGDPIFTIEIAPSTSEVAYFGTTPEQDPGTIISTRDGGVTFQENETELPLRIVNDLSIDANDPSKVYAVFSGFGTDHVYKSADYGITWESINGNLPDVPTNCIQVDPNDSNHIYVGNDIAVYFSEDGGESYSVIETGVPAAMIAMDFAISPRDNKIWIATHGNGTYRTDLLSSPVTDTDDLTSSISINLFPNPTTNVLNFELDPTKEITVRIFDNMGRLIIDQYLGSKRSLDVNALAKGNYTLTVNTREDELTVEKFIKQ